MLLASVKIVRNNTPNYEGKTHLTIRVEIVKISSHANDVGKQFDVVGRRFSRWESIAFTDKITGGPSNGLPEFIEVDEKPLQDLADVPIQHVIHWTIF